VPSFTQRYSGFFFAAATSTYQFTLTSDDGSLLWLDGVANPFVNDAMPCARLSTQS
jgi:hypothetical protein